MVEALHKYQISDILYITRRQGYGTVLLLYTSVQIEIGKVLFYSMKSRHPVPLRTVVVAVSATPPPFFCRTPPVGRNRHKQHVLDAKMPSGAYMEAFHFDIRFMPVFRKPVETGLKTNRFYPVFVFKLTPCYPVFVFVFSPKVPTSTCYPACRPRPAFANSAQPFGVRQYESSKPGSSSTRHATPSMRSISKFT